MNSKKIFLYLLFGTLSLAAIGLALYVNYQNSLYQKKLVAVADTIFDVDVEITGFAFNPINKVLTLQTVHIHNPKGYNSYYAINVPRVEISFNEFDVEQNQFDIAHIEIPTLDINYETSGIRDSNVKTVLDQLMDLESDLPRNFLVDQVDVTDIVVNLTTVRFKRQIATIEHDGFSLAPLYNHSERVSAPEIIETLVTAAMLRSADLIRTSEGKKGIHQLKEGAKLLLAEQSALHPELTKKLKL